MAVKIGGLNSVPAQKKVALAVLLAKHLKTKCDNNPPELYGQVPQKVFVTTSCGLGAAINLGVSQCENGVLSVCISVFITVEKIFSFALNDISLVRDKPFSIVIPSTHITAKDNSSSSIEKFIAKLPIEDCNSDGPSFS